MAVDAVVASEVDEVDSEEVVGAVVSEEAHHPPLNASR